MKKESCYKAPRKMKPVFLVFCEGETEEIYINFLRQKYRLPIKIITCVTGLAISPAIIRRFIQSEKIGPGDIVTSFLMYDLDVSGISEKLGKCKDSIIIASNPAVEIWFLLHSSEQNAAIATDSCIEKLRKASSEWKQYKKGSLSDRQKLTLWDNRKTAIVRSRRLVEGQNPSSMVYRLLDKLENIIDPGK